MSKNHRGAGIRNLPSRGRGTCPICHRTGVKIIYEVEIDGQKTMICKRCNATMKNKARKEKKAAKAAEAASAQTAEAQEQTQDAPAQEAAAETAE